MNEHLLQQIATQQHEIIAAIWISNWLAVLGRVMELGILWIIHRCWVLLRHAERR